MFNLKKAFQKVFGHKAIKPRKAAAVLSTPAPATPPQVTLDDARRTLVEVLKAVEEKKRSELPNTLELFFDQLAFAYFSRESFDEDYFYSACKRLGFSCDRVKLLIRDNGINAFTAAVLYYTNYPYCDLNESILRHIRWSFTTLGSGQYTFIEDVDTFESLGMAIVDDQIPAQFEDYVDYGQIGEDYCSNFDGKFVGNGFFSPVEF